MIHYPNGLKTKKNQKINLDGKSSQANRGMRLEENINLSNEYYLRNNIAVIYKKPTPIKVLHIVNTLSGSTKIDDAHFLTPSTTDYNGIYRGKYIDFEAKETKSKTLFPLASIHNHQLEHLKKVAQHGAIAFIIISFTSLSETYLIDQKIVNDYVDSGLKSLPLKDIKDKGHLIKEEYIIPLNYLKIVDANYFPCEK